MSMKYSPSLLRAIVATACGLVLIMAIPALAQAAPVADRGMLQRLTEGSGAQAHPYLVYTPAAAARAKAAGRSVPLVVVTHGCQTTADQQTEATRYNRIADREGFVVMYPDVDQIGRSMPGALHNCWRWFDPGSWHRGGGESGAISRMTRATISDSAIDQRRVYLVGMSSGGFMTSIMAATDPDLFAAVGIASAGGYADPSCLSVNPLTRPVDDMARAAYQEMGTRARVVPRLVIGGDQDAGIGPACHDKALEQGLRTNNLVKENRGMAPVPLTPKSVHEDRPPKGYSSTVRDYRNNKGCLVGQRWTVHGMGHYWSGGSPDRRWASWTDPKGPDAAEISWDFFNRQTKHCV